MSFQNGIRRLESLAIKQYRKGLQKHVQNTLSITAKLIVVCSVNAKLKLHPIGDHQPTNKMGDFMYLPGESDNTVWGHRGGVPPADGSPVPIVNPLLLPTTVLVYIYATAGIVFALVCLGFNIIFRKRKLVEVDMYVCSCMCVHTCNEWVWF